MRLLTFEKQNPSFLLFHKFIHSDGGVTQEDFKKHSTLSPQRLVVVGSWTIDGECLSVALVVVSLHQRELDL